MNDLVLQFARWLESQSFSIGLHESFYLYNWIETTHVLTLMIALGTLCIVDLRMLSWAFTSIPATKLAERVSKPMLIGFALMFATGIALYSAIPVRTTQSIWFRIKVILIERLRLLRRMHELRDAAKTGSMSYRLRLAHWQIQADDLRARTPH